MELEEAKRVLGMIAGRESGVTTVALNRDAARVVLDAFAVFEKAHAPTDDEQFAKSFSGWSPNEVARNPRAAAEVIERLRSRVIDGFRRALQSEPSDALRAVNDLALAAHGANSRSDDAEFLREHINHAVPIIRAALRAAALVNPENPEQPV